MFSHCQPNGFTLHIPTYFAGNLYMDVCSKSMIYANVRITGTLAERCNILIVKSFVYIGPDPV
ncbi:hypothetical protein A4D02_32745 [Niastella koreensis]|uniref:Uncharacterized protein n=1 Tax=Niastella koreensis TaxID=354356 RepID=A0ABX3NTN6_9BACT|nr:hypothetical protein A4D02_32745 [Niastella koreensis]